jgi:hypothetical protein
MTAGRLAAKKPAATTNTVLYRCPTTVTGSTVVNVCNQSGSAATYRMALRNYDQVLHMDGPESANGGLASSYKFTKGNPISAYKIKISPGYQFNNAIPGTQFTTTNGATAKILDVYRPINDVTYYTIVQDITTVQLAANSLAGSFAPGETVTGDVSAFTGIVRGGTATTRVLNIADVSTSATSLKISRTTGLADGMRLTLAAPGAGGEIVTIAASGINTTTNTLTITRGSFGTTPAVIRPGTSVNAWSASATTSTISEGATFAAGDTTLTLANSTGFVSGGFVLIDNEILQISAVNGNDLTVVRGRYGTAAVDHTDGSTVTLLLDNGIYLVNFFSEGEDITGASSNASATLAYATATAALVTKKYLVTTTQGGTDHQLIPTVALNLDRTYIYDLSHVSCANYPLKFSADGAEGPNGTVAGTEYTQGVSKVGVAGTAGAYTSIAVDTNTSITLFAYADGTPAASTTGVGFGLNVDTNPTYTEIYLYDVAGQTLAAGDTFTINNVTQTIQPSGVTVGPYGYVQSWDSAKCHLKIALGAGSEAFAAGDEVYDTPTLNLGYRTTTKVVDGKILSISGVGAANALRVVGTYPNLTANSTSGSGNLSKAVFTVVVTSGGAATVTIVDGGENFAVNDTVQINDGQLGNGGAPALTFTVASISTGIHTTQTQLYSDEDYIFYNNSVAANETEKNSAIVVGPGENLLVYSSAADISYVVNGFESPSEDFPVVNLTKIVTSGGGGAPVP